MVARPASCLSIACCFAVLSLLAGVPNARAQVSVSTWTPIQEGPAVTAVLGRAATSSETRPSFDFSTRFDTPAGSDYLARIEAGKASWRFERMQYMDSPEQSGQRTPALMADDVAITRITVSMIRRHLVLAGPPHGGWTPLYAGAGVGLYHFEPRTGPPYLRPWRFGAHGVAGLECPLPDRRIVLNAELQLHIPEVPGTSVARPSDAPFVILSGSVGFKIRM